jgi:hypothetical protein
MEPLFVGTWHALFGDALGTADLHREMDPSLFRDFGLVAGSTRLQQVPVVSKAIVIGAAWLDGSMQLFYAFAVVSRLHNLVWTPHSSRSREKEKKKVGGRC